MIVFYSIFVYIDFVVFMIILCSFVLSYHCHVHIFLENCTAYFTNYQHLIPMSENDEIIECRLFKSDKYENLKRSVYGF